MASFKLLVLFFGFSLACSGLAQEMDKEQRRKEFFKKFDKDGDGKISKEEREAIKKDMEERKQARPSGDSKGGARSKVDSSFLKGEVVKFTSELSGKTQTLRNEFVFFEQVKKKSTEKLPLIVYLHGSGGQGGPTSKHLKNVTASLISKYKHPFNLLIPVFQKAEGKPNGWNPDDLTTLLKFVITKYGIDQKKIFVTGHSMGGAGTFMWANSYPQLFAAIAPTSAGGAESPKGELPVKASNLKKLPIWAFHGDKDGACDYRKIDQLLKDVNRNGGKAKFTLLKGQSHNIGGLVNNDDKVLKWFLEQVR